MESEKGSEKIQILTLDDEQKLRVMTPDNKVEKREGEIRVLFGKPKAGFGYPESSDNREDIMYNLGMLRANSMFRFYNATIGRCWVPLARETFAKYAKMHQCDYLFMLDDDMIFPLNIFAQLYNRMVENEHVDIIACLAFQRRPPYLPVIYMQREGFDSARKEPYFANEIVRNYPKDTLFECDAVGFGGVLIKTSIIEAMNEPYFMSTNPSGEDILFCYNARKAGFRVFVDTACKSEHLGAPMIINEQFYEEYNKINRNYLGEAEYKK